MKNSITKLIQCLVILLAFTQWVVAQTDDGFRPASTNVTLSEYPKVTDDLRVSLRFHAPDAEKVQVGGALAPERNQLLDMEKDADGNWNLVLSNVVPGFHYYWFVVDGVQVNDPGTKTFWGYNKPTSGIEVPSPGEDFYLPKDVPHGDVREHWYHSDITGKWRSAFVYTPPGYEKDVNKNYPVLYLLHGGGENQRAWSKQGMVSFIMDNLIAEGNTTPMIVVMDDGLAIAKEETPYVLPDFETQAKVLEQVWLNELFPEIDSYYRVKAGSENRAIAGLSRGGGLTVWISLNHLDLFSAIGIFSSNTSPVRAEALADPKTAFNGVFADADAFNKQIKVFWFGAGTAENASLLEKIEGLKKKFAELGINAVYFSSPGTAHEYLTWRRSLHDFAPRIFK